MGRSFIFKCKKCGYEYEISVGVGFRSVTFPHDELYVCQCCGKWKVVEIPNAFPKMIFLNLTVAILLQTNLSVIIAVMI